MDIYAAFRDHIDNALVALCRDRQLAADQLPGTWSVEPPRDEAHGDLSTNVALVLAKPAKTNPRALAEVVASHLESLPEVASTAIAGPGFINIRLTDRCWRSVLAALLALDAPFGASAIGARRKVNVEYVSANPTGPMHVGHARGAVFGDVLASLLEFCGYDVTREYYVNDAGAQVAALARSVHVRYREALGEAIDEIPEGLYPGDYLIPVGRALAGEHGDRYRDAHEDEWLGLFKDAAIVAMMAAIRSDLDAVGITFDHFASESALVQSGQVEDVLAALQDNGMIYTGVLEPPKGKTPDDWEPRPQTLFRSTRFGDDVDRPVRKSDGSWTYFATDMAYHRDKFRRGFSDMIDVWGADHGGYVKRMKAAVAALTDGKAELDVKLCQLVHILDNGEPVKMSKRAGSFVTLRDVVDAVGRDVVRFIMLTRRNDATLDFDLAKVTEQSRDNPVFYVQYAHARVRSVFRNAASLNLSRDVVANVVDAPLDQLRHPEELALIKRIAAWPRIVEAAALAHEPHRLVFYLQELAAAFHGLWNKGNDNPNLRFIVETNADLTHARLALIEGVRKVIACGLGIVGVTPVEEMR